MNSSKESEIDSEPQADDHLSLSAVSNFSRDLTRTWESMVLEHVRSENILSHIPASSKKFPRISKGRFRQSDPAYVISFFYAVVFGFSLGKFQDDLPSIKTVLSKLYPIFRSRKYLISSFYLAELDNFNLVLSRNTPLWDDTQDEKAKDSYANCYRATQASFLMFLSDAPFEKLFKIRNLDSKVSITHAVLALDDEKDDSIGLSNLQNLYVLIELTRSYSNAHRDLRSCLVNFNAECYSENSLYRSTSDKLGRFLNAMVDLVSGLDRKSDFFKSLNPDRSTEFP